MSNPMAIAGVTATLQFWLSNVLNDPSSPLGNVTVTARAPDLAEASQGQGENADLIVNLFLHQITPNAAWRNVDLPRMGRDGATRITNQPLALDLHYLMTVYGSRDTEAEALLGFGAMVLHEAPVLSRAQIRTALSSVPSTNPFNTILKDSGLADQLELIKITPATLGREEMAWLWTALKSDYRPTFPFQVSVVLMESDQPSVFPLPVLSRAVTVQPSLGPQLSNIDLTGTPSVPAPGAKVVVDGTGLQSLTQIALVNAHLGVVYPPFAPTQTTPGSVTFIVPTDPTNLPAGVYEMTGQITDAGGNVVSSSNSLMLPLAPLILAAPPPTVTQNKAGTLVTVHCAPEVRPNQKVELIMNATSVVAQAFSSQTNVVSFQFPTLAPGSYLARLAVDGIASPMQVNWNATPPSFQGPTVTV